MTPRVIDSINKRMHACDLCPRQCKIDRARTSGICNVPATPAIYQHFMHLGEEISLVPAFVVNLCGCNLSCPTCPERHRWTQSLPIPNSPQLYATRLTRHFQHAGFPKSIEWIGGEPTLQLPFILETSEILKKQLPENIKIYINTNSYFSNDLVDAILDTKLSAIDAFVFDLKAEPSCAFSLTGAHNYTEIAKKNILSAVRNFPDAPHIVRHLAIPGHSRCCCEKILLWCKKYIPNTTINLMTTFHDFRNIANPISDLSKQEAAALVEFAQNLKLPRLLINGS